MAWQGRGMEETHPTKLTAEELRAQIRVRVLPEKYAEVMGYSLPIADGLLLGLCVDYPNTIRMVLNEDLDEMALSLEEMYEYGRRNTDAEPISPVPGDGVVRAIGGSSNFVATRATNWATLTPSVTGPAPHGILFGIPDREIILYSVLEPAEWLKQLDELANFVLQVVVDPQREHPGGVISWDVYLATPDGRISRLLEQAVAEEGKQVTRRIYNTDHTAAYIPFDES